MGQKEEEVDSQHLQQALQLITDYVEKHFEDVGADFYKEALKIHSGEAEKRNIKGTATTEEEVILKEEGVTFFKVPIIKKIWPTADRRLPSVVGGREPQNYLRRDVLVG